MNRGCHINNIKNSNSIIINGVEVNNTPNGNIRIANGKIFVDNKEFNSKDIVLSERSVFNIFVKGDVENIQCNGSVDIGMNADGDIDCGGNVSVKGDINGDVDCGGNVKIEGSIDGNIDCGGSVIVKGKYQTNTELEKWERIEYFFNTSEDIQPYYERVIEKNKNINEASQMVMTIEKLLERISDLEQDLEFLESKIY